MNHGPRIIRLANMSRVRWQPVLGVALRLIVTLLFVPPVLSKLQEPGKWAHQFAQWGYPAWGAVATTVVEIAGLIARRIVFEKRVDDLVAPGERVGLIRFGSRVDVFLPREFKARVKVGERVRGGTSILAERSTP